jgi:hypothetical protein
MLRRIYTTKHCFCYIKLLYKILNTTKYTPLHRIFGENERGY